MRKLNGVANVTYQALFPWAMAYTALPLALFLATWLRPILGIPLCALLLAAFITSIRDKRPALFLKPVDLSDAPLGKRREAKSVALPIQTMVVIAAVALVWGILGGQGGFWYQSDDWNIRNAIFRDLITSEWPVYYNDGSAALSYYIAYWLPAATAGKGLMAIGLPIEAVWPISNIMLLFWTTAGMFIVGLLAVVTVNAHSSRTAIGCTLLLAFFSTPDLLGLPLAGNAQSCFDALHLEWWASAGQFSSITTCLFWVFNQSVIPWVCTLCFANEQSFSRYLFIWAGCLASGPLPAIGLAALMLAQGFGVLLKQGRLAPLKQQLAGLLSLPNVAGVVAVAILALFFMTNTAAPNTGVKDAVENILAYPLWFPHNRQLAIGLALLVLIEGLLLPLLLFKDFHRMPLYWAVVATLVMCPFIRVGQAADFCMRASIPALLCLYVLCAQKLLSWWRDGHPRDFATWALATVLVIGAATPLMEFYRGFHAIAEYGIENVRPDAGSLEGRDFSVSNFGTDDPDGSLFFRYFAG